MEGDSWQKAKLFAKNAKKQLTISFWCGNIIKLSKANALLAQLDRASGYGPEGQGFESLTARHSATGYPLWRLFYYLMEGGMYRELVGICAGVPGWYPVYRLHR